METREIGAPEPEQPRKHRKWPIVLTILGLVFIGVSVLLQAYVRLPASPWELPDDEIGDGGFFANISGFFSKPADTGTDEEVLPSISGRNRVSGVYTFLLCGTDSDGTRTDTIMVASLNAEANTMSLVSIPRDTYIPTATRSVKKINGAYAGKNMDRLLDEVKTVVGFRPDYWLMVDLNGFEALVDALGGVDFDVPKDMKYSDPAQNLYIDVQKGMQHLDGKTALQVARYRKGYATQDLQRVDVQRQLLVAVAKKALTPAGLLKLPELKNVVSENLKTDLKWGEIAALAIALSGVDMDTGTSHGTLPTKSKTINGGSYQEVIKDEAAALINETINPFTTQIEPEDLG